MAARKTTVTKSTTKKAPARKAATKQTTATTKPPVAEEKKGRVLNEYGFVPGTDSAIMHDIAIQGGAGRSEIIDKATAEISKVSGLTTRNKTEKNITAMFGGLISRLCKENGYTIEESWRLVPPAGGVQKTKRAPAASAKKAPARKTATQASTPAKKTARKAPAAKAAGERKVARKRAA